MLETLVAEWLPVVIAALGSITLIAAASGIVLILFVRVMDMLIDLACWAWKGAVRAWQRITC